MTSNRERRSENAPPRRTEVISKKTVVVLGIQRQRMERWEERQKTLATIKSLNRNKLTTSGCEK